MNDNQFAKDVAAGLTSTPKYLLSKYFYDAEGDALFQKIMKLPEYYLTRSEYEILSNNTTQIASALLMEASPFRLIELGAGDGFKTKVLLKYCTENKFDFSYQPVDISPSIIRNLVEDIRNTFSGVQVHGETGDYFEVLKSLSDSSDVRTIVMFLGSNIGNMLKPKAVDFLKLLYQSTGRNAQVLIGFDLKKDPQLIRAAYNDSQGITRRFNLNLLNRINLEFDGDFMLDQFAHYPVYNPESATAKSYILSMKAQQVNLRKLDLTVNFKPWETIHTEISQKYDPDMIEDLAGLSGFEVKQNFFDCRHYFTLSVWSKTN